MRTRLLFLSVPLAVVASACGSSASKSAAMSDDLKQDLAAASTPKLELANASADYRPMRFVSEIEQTTPSAPVRRAPTPRPVPRRVAAPVPEAQPAPEPEPVADVAEAPQAPQPEQVVSAVPSVAPRPAALPVDVPATRATGGRDGEVIRGGGDRGVSIGGVIGVVIRGGGVGDDHCVPRRRGGGRFPFPISP